MEGLSELDQSFAEPAFRTAVTSETSKKEAMWEVLKRLHFHDSPLQMISQDMTTIRNTFEEEQTPNETICDIRERDIL